MGGEGGGTDRRTYFVINFYACMQVYAGPDIEPGASDSSVRRATDWLRGPR